jgi:hypothetical protein
VLLLRTSDSTSSTNTVSERGFGITIGRAAVIAQRYGLMCATSRAQHGVVLALTKRLHSMRSRVGSLESAWADDDLPVLNATPTLEALDAEAS